TAQSPPAVRSFPAAAPGNARPPPRPPASLPAEASLPIRPAPHSTRPALCTKSAAGRSPGPGAANPGSPPRRWTAVTRPPETATSPAAVPILRGNARTPRVSLRAAKNSCQAVHLVSARLLGNFGLGGLARAFLLPPRPSRRTLRPVRIRLLRLRHGNPRRRLQPVARNLVHRLS